MEVFPPFEKFVICSGVFISPDPSGLQKKWLHPRVPGKLGFPASAGCPEHMVGNAGQLYMLTQTPERAARHSVTVCFCPSRPRSRWRRVRPCSIDETSAPPWSTDCPPRAAGAWASTATMFLTDSNNIKVPGSPEGTVHQCQKRGLAGLERRGRGVGLSRRGRRRGYRGDFTRGPPRASDCTKLGDSTQGRRDTNCLHFSRDPRNILSRLHALPHLTEVGTCRNYCYPHIYR